MKTSMKTVLVSLVAAALLVPTLALARGRMLSAKALVAPTKSLVRTEINKKFAVMCTPPYFKVFIKTKAIESSGTKMVRQVSFHTNQKPGMGGVKVCSGSCVVTAEIQPNDALKLSLSKFKAAEKIAPQMPRLP